MRKESGKIKNLKGKECGKGICQRKHGRYFARYVDSLGKHHEKYGETLKEVREWIEDAKFADKHGNVLLPSDMTVDTWFEFLYICNACDRRRNAAEGIAEAAGACQH